jgi:hypothetical protein
MRADFGEIFAEDLASKLIAISWLEAAGDNCPPDLTTSADDAARP